MSKIRLDQLDQYMDDDHSYNTKKKIKKFKKKDE